MLDNSSSDTLWYIPVSYTTQEETKNGISISRKTFPRIWLKQEPTITLLNLTQPKSFDQWVLFNIQATGMWSAKHLVGWQRIRIFRFLCFSQTLGFRYQLVVPAFQSDSRPFVLIRRECLPQFLRGLHSVISIKNYCYKIDCPHTNGVSCELIRENKQWFILSNTEYPVICTGQMWNKKERRFNRIWLSFKHIFFITEYYLCLTYIHTHTHTRTYIHTYTHTHTYILIHIYIYIYVYMYEYLDGGRIHH